MKRNLGKICMLLGTVLVVLALSLFLKNQQEAKAAGDTAREALDQVWGVIYDRVEAGQTGETPDSPDIPGLELSGSLTATDEDPYAMTVVEINGHSYVGSLSIPDLNLELPVLWELSDAELEVAPCRYTGSTKSDDLVIGAHNYISHFARIWRLNAGAEVTFTDMDGKTFRYQVAAVETLGPMEGESLTAGEYPLTLFTCTYSGNRRTAVRCVAVD